MLTRLASSADIPALRELITCSARGLSVGFYTNEQIESAVEYVFGVDTQLIADATYYIIDGEAGPAAAGGWSFRESLFGGDQMKAAHDNRLNPGQSAARIRAFFVHPEYARRGLARRLYERCANDAAAAGFNRFELMATLPGEPLYTTLGFTVIERTVLTLPNGVGVPFARMGRDIAELART